MIYVDGADLNYGRMKMSHLMADTTEELFAMVDRIGVARKWIQKAGSAQEHFDICKSKRAAAIRAGARPITSREMIAMIHKRES